MSKNIDKVIDIALAEVGYLEKASNSQLDSKTANAGSGNWTKYARDLDAIPGFYNGKKNGYAWCDIFFDWCLVQAFGVDDAKRIINHGQCGAGCVYSAQYYRDISRFFLKPCVGDQIFFGDRGDEYHTGIVYKVDSSRVYTVEGNTSGASGVVENGGGVFKKSYALNYSKIAGYGRPLYETIEEEKEAEEIEMKVYNTVEECPKYAQETIQKLVDKGYLKGDAGGLRLSEDMIRMFVILDRAGVL